MKVRRSLTWLVVLAVLAGALLTGLRLLVYSLYPLAYEESLFQRAREQQLDPYLVAAVIRAESRFRPRATSPQGARGLMQVMPETGQWAAEQMKLPFHPDYLYDPDYNIRIGCWYLANLLKEFDGDPVLALAAYNAGRNNVRKWLAERRWTGEGHTLEQIPFPETRHYVAVVLRDYQRYLWLYGQHR
ncbi:MAG: lytic transglycosylase domain-containing protein [Bacillota bacterium]